MTQPRHGEPGHELNQLALSFMEDWTDEWAHEYDAAEGFLDDCRPEELRALVADIDALPAPYQPSRDRDYLRAHAWALGDVLAVDAFLSDVRACAVARLEGDPAARPLPPPGFPVRPHERRPEVPHPELVHLGQYVSGAVEGDSATAYLDQPATVDPVSALVYRLRQLADLYFRRLAAEIQDVRATTSSQAERLEAIGGTEIWDAEQDPDEWLELVEKLVHAKLTSGRIPWDLADL